MRIELSEQQLNNLKLFLNRATIQGTEVAAFVELAQALKPINEEVKE